MTGRDGVDGADAPDERSRREVLRAGGALGATGLFGGLFDFEDLTTQRYEAAPAALEDAAELDYWVHEAGTWETTAETLGLDGDATLANYVAAYGSQEADFGAVAMPALVRDGEATNPLASRPLEELVVSRNGRALLARAGVFGHQEEREMPEWQRGPEPLDAMEVSLLGTSTTAMAFAGVTDRDEAVLFHVARVVHEGDVVFGIQTVRRSVEGDEPTVPSWHRSRWWDHFVEVPLPSLWRFEVCLYTPWIEITKPTDGGTASRNGTTPGGYNVRVVRTDSEPWAQVEATADISCQSVGGHIDTVVWDVRRTNGPANCQPALNTWWGRAYSPNPILSFPDCRSNGPTTYDVRVRGFNANGKLIASDRIQFSVDIR